MSTDSEGALHHLLVQRIRLRISVIASGGVGTLDHLVEGIRDGHASAVLAASIFHFGTFTIGEAKRHMAKNGVAVRLDGLTEDLKP